MSVRSTKRVIAATAIAALISLSFAATAEAAPTSAAPAGAASVDTAPTYPTLAQKEAAFEQLAVAFEDQSTSELSQVVTPDFSWTLPGNNVISGTTTGVQAAINRAALLVQFNDTVTLEGFTDGPGTLDVALHDQGTIETRTLDIMSVDHAVFTPNGLIESLTDVSTPAVIAQENAYFAAL